MDLQQVEVNLVEISITCMLISDGWSGRADKTIYPWGIDVDVKSSVG